MRGAVPEDKGDKDLLTQTRISIFNWTFYWLTTTL